VALKIPTTRAELVPSLTTSGDWLGSARQLLDAYGIPIPTPVSEGDLREVEVRLGHPLPADWRALLSHLGPLDLESVAFLEPSGIRSAAAVWFREHLPEADRLLLPDLVCVASTGSDNFFVWDRTTQQVRLASHDPAGLFEHIPNVVELVRWALVGVAAGRYGWPDSELAELVEQTQADMLQEWALLQRAG
jgi:hypothetical protein